MSTYLKNLNLQYQTHDKLKNGKLYYNDFLHFLHLTVIITIYV